MNYRYKTKGTCAGYIDVEIEDDILKHVEFHGGCDGNLQGITKLIEGMNCDEIKAKLDGIKCGPRSTSCPDQLCRAIDAARAEQ